MNENKYEDYSQLHWRVASPVQKDDVLVFGLSFLLWLQNAHCEEGKAAWLQYSYETNYVITILTLETTDKKLRRLHHYSPFMPLLAQQAGY